MKLFLKRNSTNIDIGLLFREEGNMNTAWKRFEETVKTQFPGIIPFFNFKNVTEPSLYSKSFLKEFTRASKQLLYSEKE
jgi:hypothetical protein